MIVSPFSFVPLALAVPLLAIVEERLVPLPFVALLAAGIGKLAESAGVDIEAGIKFNKIARKAI